MTESVLIKWQAVVLAAYKVNMNTTEKHNKVTRTLEGFCLEDAIVGVNSDDMLA